MAYLPEAGTRVIINNQEWLIVNVAVNIEGFSNLYPLIVTLQNVKEKTELSFSGQKPQDFNSFIYPEKLKIITIVDDDEDEMVYIASSIKEALALYYEEYYENILDIRVEDWDGSGKVAFQFGGS